MKLYSVEAIVLRAQTVREANKIITIFSREQGKQRVMAYGVAKAKSRKRGAVQPLCHSQMLLYRGKVMDSIRQCAGLTYFTELLGHLEKLTLAFYLCELVDALCEENEPNEPLFILLLTMLKWLNHQDVDMVGAQKLRAGFELKMLGLLGYMPELGCCVNCGGPLHAPLAFSVTEGGMLCAQCIKTDRYSLTVNLPTVQFLRHLITAKPGELPAIQVQPRVFNTAQKILQQLTRFHLERRAKSLDFLAKLHNYSPERETNN